MQSKGRIETGPFVLHSSQASDGHVRFVPRSGMRSPTRRSTGGMSNIASMSSSPVMISVLKT
jgi:hypothetical protein